MDKHKNVRKHIAAAKSWLNQAENSLESENDIRGDLNLMLAQAELQRAKEKKPDGFVVYWLKRLAPLAAAVLLVAGYMVYKQPEAAEEMQLPVVQEAEEQSALHQTQIIHPEPPEDDVPPMPTPAEAGSKLDLRVPSESPAQAESKTEPSVPDRKLQKLMQEAGSILRE